MFERAPVYPAAILLLLFAQSLVGPTARADPTEGNEFGPQFRTATWSFDNAADYLTSNAAISGGSASLQPTGGQFTWTSGADFILNRDSSTNITVEPGNLRLAGNPNELVANGDFNGPAPWSFVSSSKITANSPPSYGRFNGMVGRVAQTFDSMESTADWIPQGSGASLSLDNLDYFEPSGSVKVTWNPVSPTDFGGARRTIGGPWNFIGWTGLWLWTNTSESGAQVYIQLADVSFMTWDSPPQPVANSWGIHEFDFTLATIDLSQVLWLEVRFTNLAGSTRSANVDILTWYERTQLNETGVIYQPVSKSSPTLLEANQSEFRFELTAVATGNVTARLDVAIANASDTFRSSILLVSPFSGTIVRDPSLNVSAAAVYNISFSLHVESDTAGVAEVDVRIDRVSFVAPGYANGSFLSNVVDLGGVVSFDTLAANATLGPGHGVTILARSGPTPAVDPSWSGWASHGPGAQAAQLPPNRYAQLLLWLNTSDGLTTPTFDDLTLTYKTYPPTGVVTTQRYTPSETVVAWHNLTWTASTPGGTAVRFEYSLNGFAWTATVGPIGVAGTASIWVRAILDSPSPGRTPLLFDVTLHFEVYGALARIVLDPSGPLVVTADDTVFFNATAYDVWDHELPTFTCTWETTDPGKRTTGNGTLVGRYEPLGAGTWIVICWNSDRSLAGNATVVVTPGRFARVAVTPPVGLVSVAKTRTFDATGFDADGNEVPLTGTQWSTTIGQIEGPGPTRATVRAPLEPGVGTITATNGTISGTADVWVDALGTPRIDGTVPDLDRPEDSGAYTWNLTAFAGNQPDADDTMDALKWYLTGYDESLYATFGQDTYGRHTIVITPHENASGVDDVVLWLEDADHTRSGQPLRIRIVPANDPPFFAHVPEVFVNCAEPYTLDFLPYVEDVDTAWDRLTLTTEDPTRITTDGLNATYRYPCTYLDRTLYVYHEVSDGQASAEAVVTIHVTDNPPPQLIKPIPPLTLTEDVRRADAFAPESLRDFFSDPEGEALFLSSNFTNLVVDIWDRVDLYVQVNVTGAPDFCGMDRITFRATDRRGAYREYTTRVTVLCVNDPPFLLWADDVHVAFDRAYRLELADYVGDVDDPRESLVLATNDTEGAAVDRFAITFLYTRYRLGPDPSYSIPVLLTLSDGADSTSVPITVLVGTNRPPELVAPFADVQFEEDSPPNPIDLTTHFADAEDLTLTYTSVTTRGQVTGTIGTGRLTLTPARDWFGQAVLLVRATDTQGAFAVATILVDVLPVNDAPVLVALPRQVRNGGGTWVLDLRPYVSDVDNDDTELSFAANVPNAVAVGYLLVFTYANEDTSTQFVLTVRDPGNLTDTVSVSVQVQGPSIWTSVFWPWSGLGALAAAAVAYVGWTRLAARRFSIEDLFLVGREGRLIMHTTRRLRADRDPDILTGMLTAIMLFVRDSFREENEDLKRFEFGDRKVAVERSEHTYAAVIFAGEVPQAMSTNLLHFLTDIEDRYGDELTEWSGDVDDLPGLRDMMEDFGRRAKWRVGDWRRLAS